MSENKTVAQILDEMKPDLDAYNEICEQYARECNDKDRGYDVSDRTMQERDDLAVALADWAVALHEAVQRERGLCG
jgi:hypothetical protein